MALIVEYKLANGKTAGARLGTNDEALARKIITDQNPGCEITGVAPEVLVGDGPATVETFADVKAWADVEKAKEAAAKKNQDIPPLA